MWTWTWNEWWSQQRKDEFVGLVGCRITWQQQQSWTWTRLTNSLSLWSNGLCGRQRKRLTSCWCTRPSSTGPTTCSGKCWKGSSLLNHCRGCFHGFGFRPVVQFVVEEDILLLTRFVCLLNIWKQDQGMHSAHHNDALSSTNPLLSKHIRNR